jgi:hypothetical protein
MKLRGSLCYLIIMVLTSVRTGAVKAKNLGPRLNRILKIVETLHPTSTTTSSSKVADIGCDHGLLSSSIAAMDEIKRVYASDLSVSAAKGALAHFESLPLELRNKVELLVGNGLEPLLSKERGDMSAIKDVDTLILSGMGVRSVFEILSMSLHNSKIAVGTADAEERGKRRRGGQSKVDYWKGMGGINNDVLAALGVTNIIAQPWPPNFLPLQSLYACVLRDGHWEFSDQGIDYVNGYHQITSAFRKCEQEGGVRQVTSSGSGDWRLSMQSNPLYQRSHGGSLRNEETAMWRDYLLIQRRSLIKRKEGLRLSSDMLGSVADADADADAEGATVDELLEIVEDHLASMK